MVESFFYPTTDSEKKIFISKLKSNKAICKRKTEYVDIVITNIDNYDIIYVEKNNELKCFCAFNILNNTLLLHYICSTGSGYGTKMVNILKEECKKLNLKQIELNSPDTNIDFYTKLEFELVDEDSVWENVSMVWKNLNYKGGNKRRKTMKRTTKRKRKSIKRTHQ